MAERLAAGTRSLLAVLALLSKDPDNAGRQADAASDAVHHVERDYGEAMAELLQVDDLRAVLAAQDLYRRYLHVAEAIIAVADRLWYVVLRAAWGTCDGWPRVGPLITGSTATPPPRSA